MICEFIECNVAEDFWCECIRCGRTLEGFMKAEDLNKLNICCQSKPKNMKCYYARPISLYNTKQDERDIQLLQKLGYDVINPNKEELEKRYAKEGMNVFLEAAKDCDVLAFRSFQDGKISAGVYKEILQTIELGKEVIELPTITSKRILSVDDTREYLKLLGNR